MEEEYLPMRTINQRFLRAFDVLKAKRKVRNKTDFTNQLGMPLEYMSILAKDERILPDRYITKLEDVFGICHYWMLQGEGEMFIDKKAPVEEKAKHGFSITPIRFDSMSKVYSFSVKFPDGRVESKESKAAHEIIECYQGGCCYFLGQHGPGTIVELHE